MRRTTWAALLAAIMVAIMPALALGETKGAPTSEPRQAVEAQLIIDGRVVGSFTDVSGLEIEVQQVDAVCRDGKDDDCDGAAWEKAMLQAMWRVGSASDALEQTAWLTTRARHDIAMNAIRNLKARVRQVEESLTDPAATLKTKHDTAKNAIGNVRFVTEVLTETAEGEAGVDRQALERLTDAVRALQTLDSQWVVRKRPGRPTYGNITFKGPVGSTGGLQDWYKQVLDGKVERKSGSIIYLDRTGAEVLRYNFFEAWPCRYSAPSMAVEQIEFVVEKIERARN